MFSEAIVLLPMEKSRVDFDLLRTVVPDWKEAKDSEIETENLSIFDAERVGLYKVTYKGSPFSVTYRKFDDEEAFQKYRYPAENGIGPKDIYCKYPILIQEFLGESKLPGVTGVLKPVVYNALFRELVKLHKIKIPKEFNNDIFLMAWLETSSKDGTQTKIEEFDLTCKEAQSRSDLTEEERTIFKKVHPIIKERDFILELIKPLNLCWCHNDLHHENLLWNAETGKAALIDFEDNGLGFRGFDIGNLLCETVWEIIKEYPKYRKIGVQFNEKDEEKMILMYTLHWVKPDWEKNLEKTGIKVENITKDSIKELILEERQRELFWAVFSEMRRELFIGLMCSCYYWVIWNALHFDNVETDDWGFLPVAEIKFDLYFEVKKRFIETYSTK